MEVLKWPLLWLQTQCFYCNIFKLKCVLVSWFCRLVSGLNKASSNGSVPSLNWPLVLLSLSEVLQRQACVAHATTARVCLPKIWTRNIFFHSLLPITLLQASLTAHVNQTSLLWLDLLMFLISKDVVASVSGVTPQGRVNNLHISSPTPENLSRTRAPFDWCRQATDWQCGVRTLLWLSSACQRPGN